jgi:uncharacterized membrane protein YgdD (TMEM256/DUF423 family)
MHAEERGAEAPASAQPRGAASVASGFTAAGAISACVAVAAGAFGAHALKATLEPGALAVFETAARYQLVHGLAVVVVGALLERPRHPSVRRAAWTFLAGTVLFSGSLYALALTGQRWWGAVTPFGGAGFIAGWLLLAWGSWRRAAARIDP